MGPQSPRNEVQPVAQEIKDLAHDLNSNAPKRPRTECSYGEGCYRKNPAHFREFSHKHLEQIIDGHTDENGYTIPPNLSLQKEMLLEQIEVLTKLGIYVKQDLNSDVVEIVDNMENNEAVPEPVSQNNQSTSSINLSSNKVEYKKISLDQPDDGASASTSKIRDSDYVPIAPPTRRIKDYVKVVLPKGNMAAKHAKSAPYHIFYTTIQDAKETHYQDYSITFQEILDASLGELKCSLQINFMVEIGWLLGQYYFAGYANKKLTILYGEPCPILKDINKKRPNVESHQVNMATPFGKHHTKMMLLCYEDGSLRVVISTANLYTDDWENRTQGLWFSPKCPELPPDAMPHDGESKTMFKKSLLKYLNHYGLPKLAYYVERVKRCDFSHINVFLVASVPGSHFDQEWAMTRVSTLLRQHCAIPKDQYRNWPLIAQASSIGSYGKDPKQWLTGDFLHNFCKVKDQPQLLTQPPPLRLIYPSLDNVKQSHDNLLGGGCLPYSMQQHLKQMWLKDFLYQWKATKTSRDKAMPHIKSYTRLSPDGKNVAFYVLTSANISKAAWGQVNVGNGALRLMSYEAGVLFLPQFVINKDFFPLATSFKDGLVIPYDLPPKKYDENMKPWVQDYMCS